MTDTLNLRSSRARKARVSRKLGHLDPKLLLLTTILFALGGFYFQWKHSLHVSYALLAVAILSAIVGFWRQYDLKTMPPILPAKQLDDILAPSLLSRLTAPVTPRSLWQAACQTSEGIFVCNHLLMHESVLESKLSTNEDDTALIWKQARALMESTAATELHGGILVAAIMLTSSDAKAFLTQTKLKAEDVQAVTAWNNRILAYIHQPKPYFGGFGRDWASGFTPTLDRFGNNLSRLIEQYGGGHYDAHSDLLQHMVGNLGRDAAVALVGPDGVGKSALVEGLAQRLLQGQDPELKYYQVVSLNASLMLSYSGSQLEKLVLTLFGEAIRAGNIILFLDDAQLFFGKGVGAFDMSQILLPVLKNRSLKLIAAFTPNDWQQLRSQQQAVADSFASLVVTEPSETVVYNIVEDAGLLLENRYKTLVSYEAVREAYRLSGQYLQDQAYPGKVLTLLEQAIPLANEHILTAQSIQATIEKTKGVKVSAAQAPEADILLHLEDKIHERMINQTQAVTAVASALRRGRAGVSSPKRPIGSFLFLGPTGVGKTELARSLAAVYFGSEQQFIRLDMSEYQRPEDVSRLLATGGSHEQSLLMSIRQQPFSVVLLDEVEKAHPNILNLLLQILDEGQLTDGQGRPASFRSAIIIATSNAGALDIAAAVKTGKPLAGFERELIDKLISSGQFKPELVNRFDEIALFRPLTEAELAQVAQVMLKEVNKTLANQEIDVQLTPEALRQLVHLGYDPEFGARPMRRIIQKTVENTVAVKILRKEAGPGSHILLDVKDLEIQK